MLLVADAVLPAESVALAVMVWLPSATLVEFHESVHGPAPPAWLPVPSSMLSTLNSTLDTLVSSLAVADSVTVPETVALLAGNVRLTVGGVVSCVPPLTVTVIGEEVVLFPAAS